MAVEPGAAVLYGNWVTGLSASFFIFPVLLLTGHREEEDIFRRSSLMALCTVVPFDMLWNALHPQPLRLGAAAAVAGLLSALHTLHLTLAFRITTVVPYTYTIALSLQVLIALLAILVTQVGTAYIVSSNRSGARFQMLAWITIMIIGSLGTAFPALRKSPALSVAVASLPRIAIFLTLLLAGRRAPKVEEATNGQGASEKDEEETEMVPVGRVAKFLLFAANGSTGESLNDMATDLKVREALAAGNTTLALSYNAAVILSMCGGFLTESLASGKNARCGFAVVWGLCQLGRGFGMEYLTADRTWLMFVFVLFDKFAGPLGQAAIDTALLAVMKAGRSKDVASTSRTVPANALWTMRTVIERLERPACQLMLLTLQMSNAPPYVPPLTAGVSVMFVLHTLLLADDDKVKKEA
eukprot:TRINITY_DN38493_c0_g1_i1.p1 TRINITY_DN38493_c0_g1~~TRINITY_DN38493_c0_g1_i1.p1  ORF type:complete len:412 (-),score=67.31 TRINITY_DN38493_c0_g1_i1:498-1733(-)